ncbi:MAG: EamA family transporter [Clostridia bacterium]|nr:EamA family transporter [Clostridia bacterium]
MWLYWCLLSTFIGGFTSIAMKKCSNNDKKRMAIMGLFSYHFITILVSIAIKPELVFKLNFVHMLYMLPGLILQSLGYFCVLASIRYGKVAITSSIRKCNVVVIFLLGIIVLKEEWTILQVIVSIVLVILSIILATKKDSSELIDKKLEKKAIFYAYGYVLCNGISKIFNKIYVTEFEDPLYVVFNFALVTIIGILMYCIITKKWEYIDLRKMNSKGYFLLQSFLDSSSSILSRFAMLDGNISIISVISTSSIVITVLTSRIILKEKITWKKYFIILGIFICVLMLSIL